MASVIAVISILLLAGAFMWIQPSKRDKHLARLRSNALTQGFMIGSVKLPDTSEYGRVNSHFIIQTTYQIALKQGADMPPEFTVMRTSGESGIYLPDGWSWYRRDNLSESLYRSVSLFIQTLPESVTALVVSKASVGLVWNETDPELNLDKIKTLLHSVADFCELEPHRSD